LTLNDISPLESRPAWQELVTDPVTDPSPSSDSQTGEFAGFSRRRAHSSPFTCGAGMRLGEVLNLQCQDIDWPEGLLTIRKTKFGKSRLIPLHASTFNILAAFAKRRDRFFAEPPSRPMSHFFVTKFGTRLQDMHVYRVFWPQSRQIGIREPGANRGPRLHDFRHYPGFRTIAGSRWPSSAFKDSGKKDSA
jgi:integrase